MNTVNTDTGKNLQTDEEELRISQRRAEMRRIKREKERRKKRNLIISSCIAWSLVIILAAALIIVVRAKSVGSGGGDAKDGGKTAKAADSVPLKKSKDDSAEDLKMFEENETQETGGESEAVPQPKNEFASFYYYEEDKQDRYEAYQELNPEMDPGDVVWRVNAYLDKPWYEYDVPVDTYDDPLMIVNKYYTVPDGYRPPDLVSIDGYEMRKETGDAYLELKAAAKAAGKRIRAVSAYRSVDYQKGLYNRYLSSDSKENVDRYSARPGHSEHHTGMAIDLFGSTDGLRNFINTPEGPWVREHCWEYGFIIRYTADIEGITGYEDEPWHIRYVGKEVSMDMKEKGIESFEEYHVKYIEHSPDEK